MLGFDLADHYFQGQGVRYALENVAYVLERLGHYGLYDGMARADMWLNIAIGLTSRLEGTG